MRTRIGYRRVPVYVVEVEKAENEQDWVFAWIKRDAKTYGMAVF